MTDLGHPTLLAVIDALKAEAVKPIDEPTDLWAAKDAGRA